ncbi:MULTISPECIES: OmpP1/FadL family transporter [unclassified Acinetobacter]|uniref:OmpP1/FadL family transporter n=1 Tax=unclassified Acinetobacter TaxID=196816 RepID=UPI00211F11EB|nr:MULTISPECIES: outer membrane protein transport protein [unclassified Acinetobacter]UUS61697.1 outer membrane protein transport protein [Acinetobacter sp. YH16056_T]
MKNQFVAVAVGIVCPIQIMYAAGIENSDQSISAFLEPGNYTEASFAYVDAQVDGKVQNQGLISELGITDFSTGNLAHQQFSGKFALKIQPHENISAGVIYEQPFHTDISYQYSPRLPDSSNIDIESADINFRTHNLTGLVGYQPNNNWNIYSGLSLQTFKGDLKISGQQYAALNGYHADFKQDEAIGWLLGFSYQIPEYAIKTSLTYRSKIKHENKTSESTLYSNGPFQLVLDTHTSIQTPQSVNFDFQTAISPHNVVYGTVRWINWKDFNIQPPQFNAVLQYAALDPQYRDLADIQLVEYQKDQWSGKLGIAHQFNPSWLAAAEFIWDNGTGNAVSTLNPSDGYRGLGLGMMYKFNPNNFLATGLYYMKLSKPSNTEKSHISGLASVSDNDAMIYGLKFGHRF